MTQGIKGQRPHLVVVDEATDVQDEPLPGVDVPQLIDEHVRADRRPHYGDPDHADYCDLFNAVTRSLAVALEGSDTHILFSRRRRLVDELWSRGYRRVSSGLADQSGNKGT